MEMQVLGPHTDLLFISIIIFKQRKLNYILSEYFVFYTIRYILSFKTAFFTNT